MRGIAQKAWVHFVYLSTLQHIDLSCKETSMQSVKPTLLSLDYRLEQKVKRYPE